MVAIWAVSAWSLVGRVLSLELHGQAAATLGFPRITQLHLDVDDEAIRRARAALLEILQMACFVVDPPENPIASSAA
ncbi:hypothetical protein ABGB21_32155 [Plantactinospora sp. B24E8]